MLTMLLGGLWHGASWNFVLWGGLHGAALVVHGGWRSLTERWNLRPLLDGSLTYRIVAVLAMQYFILVTWIPVPPDQYGSDDLRLEKVHLLRHELPARGCGPRRDGTVATVLLIIIFMLIHLGSEIWGGLDVHLARLPLPVAATACVLIGVVLFILWPSPAAPFIYFQF